MEWEHKGVQILLEEETGLFTFFNQEKKEVEKVESLREARRRVAEVYKSYYDFKLDDIKALLDKLNDRERDFVIDLIKELDIHDDNCYCVIGIYNRFHFNFNFAEFIKLLNQNCQTNK